MKPLSENHYSLTPVAAQAIQQWVESLLPVVRALGRKPPDLAEYQAYPQGDGTLLLRLNLGQVRAEMTIPPEHWLLTSNN